MLDVMHDALEAVLLGNDARYINHDGFNPQWFERAVAVDSWAYPTAAANLARLELAYWTGRNSPPHVLHTATRQVVSQSIQLTLFGSAFVVACQPPSAARTRIDAITLIEPD